MSFIILKTFFQRKTYSDVKRHLTVYITGLQLNICTCNLITTTMKFCSRLNKLLLKHYASGLEGSNRIILEWLHKQNYKIQDYMVISCACFKVNFIPLLGGWARGCSFAQKRRNSLMHRCNLKTKFVQSNRWDISAIELNLL